jgi:anti-sigma regulatory factor (Ser/Thr protein kinase)
LGVGARRCVRGGHHNGETVLARVKSENADALGAALAGDDRGADVGTADDFYENASRTRAKFLDWVSGRTGGSRIRMLGEPPWPLDSAAGVRDWARHEAVINLAFAGLPVTFACPYDAGSLPPEIIDHAEHTHPSILTSGGSSDSPSYAEPDVFCESLDGQVPLRTGLPAMQMPFDRGNLHAVRELVAEEGSAAGLSGNRLFELMLAVDEIATNAVLHGASPANLKLWREPGELIWEVADTGPGIADPLVGQLAPDSSAPGGRGLWMARMICDWVEFRSDEAGTIVALHVSVPLN